MYQGIDTLVLTTSTFYNVSRKSYVSVTDDDGNTDLHVISDSEIDMYELKEFAKEDDLRPFSIKDYEFLMSKKAYSFYQYKFYDKQQRFQFAYNDNQFEVRILAATFYLTEKDNDFQKHYKSIIRELGKILYDCFGIEINEMRVSRLDYATDILFAYDFLNRIRVDDIKTHYMKETQLHHSDYGGGLHGITIGKSGMFQVCIYDKIVESSRNKQKKQLFFQMLGIKDDIDYISYLESNKKLVRIEYRLRREALKPFGIFKFGQLSNDMIKAVVWHYAKHNTYIDTKDFQEYFVDSLETSALIKCTPVLEDSYHYAKMQHIINTITPYLARYHVYLEKREKKIIHIDEIFKDIKHKAILNEYNNLVAKNRIKLK